MSFYAHPFNRRQAPAYGYPYATGPAASPAPSFNFFTAPPAEPRRASYYDDIDAEEQAALAHLRAIQQRREAAQLAARREAALQARIAAQREAAYAAVVERERAREEAIRHLIAEKQRRQEAAAAAHAIAAEHQRRAQAIAAQRQAHALAARHAYAQRAIEEEKRAEEFVKRRNACARRCAGGCAKKEEEKKEHKDEWKEVNDVLASLFGINISDHDQSAEEPVKETKPATPVAEALAAAKVEQKAETVDSQPAAPAASTESANNTEQAETQSDTASFDLNDLLSTFLGVSLEPAKEGDKATEGADKLTAKLNDFLSQFGLEFEATPNAAESSSSAAKSAPAPAPVRVDTPARAPTPASAPVEGKGKGVAEGEKPAQAAEPAEAAISKDTALDKLRDISHELHLATESFTFPSKLAFADTTNAEAAPTLLFNKGNSGYHAQAHKLLQLLLAADGISSGGDREVRKQRKAIVKAIEGAIEQLEQKRDAVWAEVKEKREQGAESSDDEGSVSSWNSTEPEHIEHANDEPEAKDGVNEAAAKTEAVQKESKAKEDKDDQTHAEAAAPVDESNKEEVQGFEVPTETEEKPAGEEAKPQAAADSQAKKASVRDEDFELL